MNNESSAVRVQAAKVRSGNLLDAIIRSVKWLIIFLIFEMCIFGKYFVTCVNSQKYAERMGMKLI